eukprot:g11507.t1
MSDALKERCNVRDYNDEIIDLGRAGRHEEILNVLGVMKRNKCWPTVLTYDLAVRACVEGQKIDPLALNVIRDMRSMGLRLEERTACCILNGSKNVLPSKILREIKKSGVAPVGKVRQAYIYALCNSGQLTQACEDFRMALSNSSLLRVEEDIFIHFFSSCRRRTRATTILEFFQLIEICRLPKSLDIYKNLIDALVRAKCCRDAMPFLKECTDSYGIKASLPSICNLIVAFGEINKVQTSKDLYGFVCQHGFRNSPITTGALMRACARGKRYEDLMSVFAKAAKEKLLPKHDVNLYSEIMKALCDATRSADCAEIIDTLQRQGHALGAHPRLLSYLVTSLVSSGQMTDAIKLFMTIGGKTELTSGIGVTLAKLVEEVGNHHDVNQLNLISNPISIILKRRFDDEDILWGKLIEAYVKCDEIMIAVDYYHRMLKIGIAGSRCGINNAMIAFATLKREQQVQKLLKRILDIHGSMGRDTFQALVISYTKLSDEDKVIEYIDLFLLCERFRRLRAVRAIRKWWYSIVAGLGHRHEQAAEANENALLSMRPCHETSVDEVEDTIESAILGRVASGHLDWAKKVMIRFHTILRLLRPYTYYMYAKTALGRFNDTEGACWALMQLHARDIPPSRPIFNDLISAYSKEQKYEDAKACLGYFLEHDLPTRQMLHSILQCVVDDDPVVIYDTFIKHGVVANEISIGFLISALVRLKATNKAVGVWKRYRTCEGMGPIPPQSLELLFDLLLREHEHRVKTQDKRLLRLASKVATDLERCNHPIPHKKAYKLFTYTLNENHDLRNTEAVAQERDEAEQLNNKGLRAIPKKSSFMKKFDKWNNSHNRSSKK